jgi:hypothetical protein
VGLYVAILPVGGRDADPTILEEIVTDAVDDALVPLDDSEGVRLAAALPLPDPVTDALTDASPD